MRTKQKRISTPKNRSTKPSPISSPRQAGVSVLVLKLADPRKFESARILEANPASTTLCGAAGVKSLIGKPLASVPYFASPELIKKSRESLQNGESMTLSQLSGPNKPKRPTNITVRAVRLSADRVILTLEDSSAQAAAEQAVRRSEETFQLLIHSVKDYAIIMLDPRGKILTWNAGAERLKGYRTDEVIGKNYDVFFQPEDRQKGKAEAQLRQAAKEGQSEDEGWLVRKDGWTFWANTVITALHDDDGRIYGFAKITRDITERKEREESIRMLNEHLEGRIEERTAELVHLNEALQSEVRERKNAEEQLRALAARQERVREDERTRLAREIHDALGQMCTALKMDIAWIAKRLPKEQRKLGDKAQGALQLVGELIKSLRRLSTELRPSTLDALGLVASIEWQAQQFEAHTGIRCQLNLPDKDLDLDKERSTAIFRIFQETLTNVARHAGATLVQANLLMSGSKITLITHDNGAGFDLSGIERKGSLGLLGMRERAHLLGGELGIISAPGRGTTVTVNLPLLTN